MDRRVPPKTASHQGSHQGQGQGTFISNFSYLNKCVSKVGPVQEIQMGRCSNRKSYSQSMEWLQMDCTKNRQL